MNENELILIQELIGKLEDERQFRIDEIDERHEAELLVKEAEKGDITGHWNKKWNNASQVVESLVEEILEGEGYLKGEIVGQAMVVAKVFGLPVFERVRKKEEGETKK